MDAKQLVDEFQRTWEAMKASLDANREHYDGEFARYNARLDALETKLMRPALDFKSYDPGKPPSRDQRLFWKSVAAGGPAGLRDPSERAAAERLRTAIETKAQQLYPEEVKVLSLGDDTAGGFLASADFNAEILKGVQLYSPIRQVARIRPTTSRSVQFPVRAGTFTAVWVGEMATRSETTGLKYSLEEVAVNEVYAEVLISEQDLEDSAFDMQAEIASEAAEQFAVAEGKAFVSGTGLKQPEGFLTNAAVEHVPSGSASTVTADALINLVYAVKEAYARNGTFALNRKSVGVIRQLKDAVSGAYLWQPGLMAGAPSSILGQPYIEAADMPDISGGAFPVAFGDFRRAYAIVDRVSIMVKRLNEKYAEQGQVGFLLRKRVGGQVLVPEAILKLEIASS